MSLYLRSINDYDTHRGDLLQAGGVVEAHCGIKFTNKPASIRPHLVRVVPNGDAR